MDDERFGAAAVNVAGQRRDGASLLNWMERLIRRRRECPETAWGHAGRVRCAAGVFAHRCDWRGATLVAAHNLTGRPVRTILELDDVRDGDQLLDLLGERDAHPPCERGAELELGPYDCRWLRVSRPHQRVLP